MQQVAAARDEGGEDLTTRRKIGVYLAHDHEHSEISVHTFTYAHTQHAITYHIEPVQRRQ